MSDRRASRKVRVLSLSLMGLKQWDSGGKMVSKEGNKDRTPASYFWLCGVWESCVVYSTQLLQVVLTQLVANSEMCTYTHGCGVLSVLSCEEITITENPSKDFLLFDFKSGVNFFKFSVCQIP